jgi:hypothetical protein
MCIYIYVVYLYNVRAASVCNEFVGTPMEALYILGTGGKENTASNSSIVGWRRYPRGPNWKLRSCCVCNRCYADEFFFVP